MASRSCSRARRSSVSFCTPCSAAPWRSSSSARVARSASACGGAGLCGLHVPLELRHAPEQLVDLPGIVPTSVDTRDAT